MGTYMSIYTPVDALKLPPTLWGARVYLGRCAMFEFLELLSFIMDQGGYPTLDHLRKMGEIGEMDINSLIECGYHQYLCKNPMCACG